MKKFNQLKILELQAQGVIFIDPEHTYIDETTIIGSGTVIYPNVIIENCVIGKDNTITLSSHLINAHLGDRNVVESSKIINSTLGHDNQIGPYAHIREATKIANRNRIGNFVEIKKSICQDDVKASHLSYLGDSDIGTRTNLGCGTITVNYDGFIKHRTVIGADCFIGCNSNLIAPLRIGDQVIVGAGSTVIGDVNEQSLVLSRPPLVVKPDYYHRWRQKGEKKNDIKR